MTRSADPNELRRWTLPAVASERRGVAIEIDRIGEHHDWHHGKRGATGPPGWRRDMHASAHFAS